MTAILTISSLSKSQAFNTNVYSPISQQKELCFFDAEEPLYMPMMHKVMHLTVDQQTSGEHVKGNTECSLPTYKVNEFLTELDYHTLTGHSEPFDTLAHAITTVERLQ